MTRLALTAALLALATSAYAQDLSGTWHHAGSSRETADRRASIDTATTDLPAFVRGRARSRLTTKTAPPARLSIAVNGDRVELTQGGHSVVVTIGGPAVTVSHGGERGQVRATRRHGDLRIAMSGEGGTRTTTYHLSANGQRLTLHVRMTAERLASPIVYHATYRKGGA